jgi:signal transduction histidine kinase
LVVEDSLHDVELLLLTLRKGGYEPEHQRVDTADAMARALQEEEWDIVVSDYSMPGFNGLEALRLLRETREDLPFFVLSGTIGEETAVEVMRAGAQDYLMKGNLSRLLPAIGRELGEARRRKLLRRELEEKTEQLLQAQKLEAVAGLARGVAHDFNNLLHAILTSCQIGIQALPADGAHRAWDSLLQIEDTVERAQLLVRKLLTFSRDRAVAPRAVDVGARLGGMAQLLARVLGPGVRLELAVGSGVPRATIDPGQLEQVVVNLAVNGRDAMGGNGALTITVRRAEVGPDGEAGTAGLAPGEYVALSVQDTGAGMSPEVKAKIFEPFFTTKPEGKGTGLGLSTVYGIVTQAAGGVAVRSAPGEGARFEVFLPAAKGAPEAEEGGPEGAARALLLAEPAPKIAPLLEPLLAARGLALVTAASVAEALRMARARPGEFRALLACFSWPPEARAEAEGALRREAGSLPVLWAEPRQGQPRPEEILAIPFSVDELMARMADAGRP